MSVISGSIYDPLAFEMQSFSRIYNGQNELDLGSAYVRTDRATALWHARIVLPAGRILHSKTDFLVTRLKHFMIR